MNDRLTAVLREEQVLCPCMAALGYPKVPGIHPSICEITGTRMRFISTTKQQCSANGTCLVFQTFPVEASAEARIYHNRQRT